MLAKTACTAGGIAWLSLSLWAFAAEPTNYVLPALLLSLALLWLRTAALLGQQTFRVGALWSDASLLDMRLVSAGGSLDDGGALLLLGTLVLIVLLTARLFASERFGGEPAAFFFGGLKCVKTGARGSGPEFCKANDNRAFEPEFNSFGHCVQGCLLGLLVPPVEGAVARALGAVITACSRKPPPSQLGVQVLPRGGTYAGTSLLVVRGSAVLAVVYPVYNIVKRAAKSGSSFAASSFANNGAEWGMGALLSLSASLLAVVAANAAVQRGEGQEAAAAGGAPVRGKGVERGDDVEGTGTEAAGDEGARATQPPQLQPSQLHISAAVVQQRRSRGSMEVAMDLTPVPPEDTAGGALHWLRRLRVAVGVLMYVCSAIAALLLGLSWNCMDAGFQRRKGSKADAAMTAALLLVPFLLAVAAWRTVAHQRSADARHEKGARTSVLDSTALEDFALEDLGGAAAVANGKQLVLSSSRDAL